MQQMSEVDRLWERLKQIHERVQWMADREAVAALVSGYGANGEFMEEKLKLIKEAERILDKIADGGSSNA